MIAYLWHDVPGLQKFGLVETVSDVSGQVELGLISPVCVPYQTFAPPPPGSVSEVVPLTLKLVAPPDFTSMG